MADDLLQRDGQYLCKPMLPSVIERPLGVEGGTPVGSRNGGIGIARHFGISVQPKTAEESRASGPPKSLSVPWSHYVAKCYVNRIPYRLPCRSADRVRG